MAPLAGAGLGWRRRSLLCWLLYRQAIRLDLGTFFNRTAIALIVIAAGVLAAGLSDLQEAGVRAAVDRFDLTAHWTRTRGGSRSSPA